MILIQEDAPKKYNLCSSEKKKKLKKTTTFALDFIKMKG